MQYSIQAYKLKKCFLFPPLWISTPQTTDVHIQEVFPPPSRRITYTTEYRPTDSRRFMSSVRLYRVNFTLQAHTCKETVPSSDFGKSGSVRQSTNEGLFRPVWNALREENLLSSIGFVKWVCKWKNINQCPSCLTKGTDDINTPILIMVMDKGKTVKKIFQSKLEGNRRSGRPRVRWLKEVEKDLREMKVKRWRQKAIDSEEWAYVNKEAKAVRGIYSRGLSTYVRKKYCSYCPP